LLLARARIFSFLSSILLISRYLATLSFRPRVHLIKPLILKLHKLQLKACRLLQAPYLPGGCLFSSCSGAIWLHSSYIHQLC
jgi:hypothetical protein